MDKIKKKKMDKIETKINYTILYCMSVRTVVIPFYFGSVPVSGTINNYGSGSRFVIKL
jgi:hypothetical protein